MRVGLLLALLLAVFVVLSTAECPDIAETALGGYYAKQSRLLRRLVDALEQEEEESPEQRPGAGGPRAAQPEESSSRVPLPL